MYIPLNKDAYTPNTPNNGSPKQANQTAGHGFFTTPSRTSSGRLQRTLSTTFTDAWSQPRLFWNSLIPTEKQFVVDAIRFENANVASPVIRQNVIIQLNRISNELATRVAAAIGIQAPEPDPTFYHENKTANIGAFGQKLLKLEGLKVGLLASVENSDSIAQGATLRSALQSVGVDVLVVGERLADGVDQTYSASDAISFDAVIVADGAQSLFTERSSGPTRGSGASTLYPAGRPLEILVDAFRFGKTVGALGRGPAALRAAEISRDTDGVVVGRVVGEEFVTAVKEGLRTWRFLDRFAVDE